MVELLAEYKKSVFSDLMFPSRTKPEQPIDPCYVRKRLQVILKRAGCSKVRFHDLRHTFATNLVNGVKQPDGTIRSLSPRQVADLLGHSTSEITELYYVKKDTARLAGITTGFDL